MRDSVPHTVITFLQSQGSREGTPRRTARQGGRQDGSLGHTTHQPDTHTHIHTHIYPHTPVRYLGKTSHTSRVSAPSTVHSVSVLPSETKRHGSEGYGWNITNHPSPR